MQECELSIECLHCGRVVHELQAVGFISDDWIFAKVGEKFVAVKTSDTFLKINNKSAFEEATQRTMLVDSKTGLKDGRIHSFDKFDNRRNLSKRIEDYIAKRMKLLSYGY